MKNIQINTSNYEAWLLDYSEGVLKVDEIELLKAFLLDHPELDADMELDSEVVLLAPAIKHPDMGSLLMPTEEESALILAAEEGRPTEGMSSEDTEAYKAYQSTLLKPDLSIVYPDKSELYRKDWTPIIPIWAQGLAIAASIIGAMMITVPKLTQGPVYEGRQSAVALPSIDVDQLLKGPVDYETPKQIAGHTPEPAKTEIAPKAHITPRQVNEGIAEVSKPRTDSVEIIDSHEFRTIEEIPSNTANNENSVVKPDTYEESDVEPAVAIANHRPITEVEKPTTELNSLLDLAKYATRDNDLLAIENAQPAAAYTETSVRVGSVKLSLKRKKRKN